MGGGSYEIKEMASMQFEEREFNQRVKVLYSVAASLLLFLLIVMQSRGAN